MWQLDGNLANLETARLSGKLDLRQPQTGLHTLRLKAPDGSGDLPAANLLQLTLPGSSPTEVIRDGWIRGCDLVTVYAPTPQRASQPEIYWRYLTASDAVGLELIISVQTDLLDDHPSIRVVSDLPASEVWWLPERANASGARQLSSGSLPTQVRGGGNAGVTIVRWRSHFSYVEMVHPADFSAVELAWHDGRLRLSTELFPERLEKGVIRRGRIRGWFLPADGDVAAAARLREEFAQSELPLTT